MGINKNAVKSAFKILILKVQEAYRIEFNLRSKS